MQQDKSRGIVAMLVGVGAFSFMDSSMKVLAQTLPPLEVACIRGAASIPFFLLGAAVTREWRSLVPARWGEHGLRGMLAVLMIWSFVYAVSHLSLASAYGIFLCAPLLVTALSALVLREYVGAHRWTAIACGLAGVIVILNPSHHDLLTVAGIAAFVSALCYACSAVMIRRLTRTDSTVSIAFSFVVIVAVAAGAAAWPDWIPVTRVHWPWIILVGISGAVGQYMVIYAFRCAAPQIIAPFEFTALLWAICIDWVLFETAPGARVVSGAAIVIASGLYLIFRERRIVPVAAPAMAGDRP